MAMGAPPALQPGAAQKGGALICRSFCFLVIQNDSFPFIVLSFSFHFRTFPSIFFLCSCHFPFIFLSFPLFHFPFISFWISVNRLDIWLPNVHGNDVKKGGALISVSSFAYCLGGDFWPKKGGLLSEGDPLPT